MTKRLYVSSAVQAKLMADVLIPQMKDGFWKNHRPANHYKEWEDVEIVVSSDDRLGPDNFKIPRTYNFINPVFIKQMEMELLQVAQTVKPNSNIRSVKKELVELNCIVGGRLTSKTGIRTKANRGTNIRAHTAHAVEAARELMNATTVGVKRTAVKRREPVEPNVEIIKTSNGATIRRVRVSA
jgi:hypothetical protein